MIVRVFRARPHPGMDKEFGEFLTQTALPMMQKEAGCVDVVLGRTRWGGPTEFVVISRWVSLDALKAFVGPDWQEPRVLPEEAHMVKQVLCEHYETM